MMKEQFRPEMKETSALLSGIIILNSGGFYAVLLSDTFPPSFHFHLTLLTSLNGVISTQTRPIIGWHWCSHHFDIVDGVKLMEFDCGLLYIPALHRGNVILTCCNQKEKSMLLKKDRTKFHWRPHVFECFEAHPQETWKNIWLCLLLLLPSEAFPQVNRHGLSGFCFIWSSLFLHLLL